MMMSDSTRGLPAYRPIPRDETLRLIAKAQRKGAAGRAAMQTLIEQNHNLVSAAVRRYRPGDLPSHVDRDDLRAEGICGLMRAVEKFDPARGTQFSTYAVPWIRAFIQRFVEKQYTLTTPVHMVRNEKRMRRASQRFQAERGREPSLAELSAAASMSLREIQNVTAMPRVICSLDTPVAGVGTVGELVEELRDVPAADDLAPILNRVDKARLVEFLEAALPPRHWRVVRLMWGFHPDYPDGVALNVIGAHMGITGERVRQIVQEAKKILRRPPLSDKLREMLRD